MCSVLFCSATITDLVLLSLLILLLLLLSTFNSVIYYYYHQYQIIRSLPPLVIFCHKDFKALG